MFQWVPSRTVRWIYAFSFVISYKGFVPQTDIFSKLEVPISQAIRLYPITLQIILNFPAHNQPKSLRVLQGYIKPKITSKLAFIEQWIILGNVNSDFPSRLRVLCLFQVYDLHTSSAIHLHKESSNQIPGTFEILVFHRDMELPIRSLMSELILGMPVDATELGVEFYEAIVAQGFVITLLGDAIPIRLEELVCELVRNDEIVALIRCPFQAYVLHTMQQSIINSQNEQECIN